MGHAFAPPEGNQPIDWSIRADTEDIGTLPTKRHEASLLPIVKTTPTVIRRAAQPVHRSGDVIKKSLAVYEDFLNHGLA